MKNFCTSCNTDIVEHADGSLYCSCDSWELDNELAPLGEMPACWELDDETSERFGLHTDADPRRHGPAETISDEDRWRRDERVHGTGEGE